MDEGFFDGWNVGPELKNFDGLKLGLFNGQQTISSYPKP